MAQIGFGTWPLGGRSYGPVSTDDALRALAEALTGGVDFIDTADIYGDGRAEELLGEALVGHSHVQVITKAGYICEAGSEQDFSHRHLRERAAGSLRRLRRSTLDGFLLHSPPRAIIENGAALEALERLRSEGLTRTIGISLASIEDADLALARGSLQWLEVVFNLLDQRALDTRLPMRCLERGVGLIARVPLCFGFLTGKFHPGQSMPADDQRARWSTRQRDRWALGAETFRFLVRPDRSIAQAALAFTLAPPGFAHVIPGMKNRSQVAHNLAAADQARRLSQAELGRAREVWRSQQHLVPRTSAASPAPAP